MLFAADGHMMTRLFRPKSVEDPVRRVREREDELDGFTFIKMFSSEAVPIFL